MMKRAKGIAFFQAPGALLVISLGASGCASSEPPRKQLSGPACEQGAESGEGVGSLIEDFALEDQHGETVLLSDFCGQVILLQMGAMWCPTCQSEAERIPELLESFGTDFVALNVLSENGAGDPARPVDLDAWAEHFDLTSPVLADPGWRIWDRYFPSHTTPRSILIGADGRIRVIDFVVVDSEIESAIADR